MSLKSLLNSTCSIYRITTTQNSFGEEVETENLTYSNLKCRVVGGSISEIKEGDVLNVSVMPYKVFIEPSYSLLRLDIVLWNGIKLRALSAKKDSSNNHYELDCQLVTG